MNSLPSRGFIHASILSTRHHGPGALTGNRSVFLLSRGAWLDGRRWQRESHQELAQSWAGVAENTIWEHSKHLPEKVKPRMSSDRSKESRWVKEAPRGGWSSVGMWAIPGRGNSSAEIWRLSGENAVCSGERDRERKGVHHCLGGGVRIQEAASGGREAQGKPRTALKPSEGEWT